MSTTVNKGPISTHRIPLEQAAQDFADATANPPFLYDLGPEKGREVVNQTQAGEIAKPEVTDEWIKVPGGPGGDISVRIVRPAGATGILPVILYIHGAGWVFGNAGTHDRLVRELAARAGAAAVFPEYSLPRRSSTRSHSRSATRSRGGWPKAPKTTASTALAWRSPATRSGAT